MAQSQIQAKHGRTDEGEDFISSLPTREAGCGGARFFLFQGCWLSPEAIQSIMLVQAHFQPRTDDIILATYPKSGTTWLKTLLFTIANRSRHMVTSDSHPVLTSHPHDLVPFIELPYLDLHHIMELEALPSPRLLSTHLPCALLPSGASALGCRVVYLCREPKDVLVSMWHFVSKVYKGIPVYFDNAFELFCEGVSTYGPLWEHYLGYGKQSMEEPGRVLFLKYNEMMAHPAKHVEMIAMFLGVPFTSEEESAGVVEEVVRLCSFENLKSLPVNSAGVCDRIGGFPVENSSYFRCARVGDWENYLTEEMARKLDRIIEEKLKGSGLSFCHGENHNV